MLGTINDDRTLEAFLKKSTVDFLNPIAESFFGNLKHIRALMHLPDLMFIMAESERGIRTLSLEWARQNWGMDYEAFTKKVLEDVKPFIEHTAPKEFYEEVYNNSQKRFQKYLQDPEDGPIFSASINVLYSTAILYCWTVLECVATDCWVAAVNANAQPLGQMAITSLEDQEPGEISSKQIPVGLAAKHGFDLRFCLGDLLKSKFDFTSVVGIKKAYKVFGPLSDYVEEAFAFPLLSELEATRHVIVHRAGKVDEDYKKRLQSVLEIGTTISFSQKSVMDFQGISSVVGLSLLTFVHNWVQNNIKNAKQ